MSVTPPVHADVLPIGPSIDDPDNFDPEADAFVADLRPFGIQMNALSDNVYANALAVQTLAAAADGSAQSATTSAGQALNSKAAAVQAAQDAGVYAQAAADSAAAAAVSSTSLTANSASAVVLGNGTKVFTVPAGKQFPPGELLQIGSTGTPAARMFGTVASYVGTALTVSTTKTQGPAGTYSDWVIAPAGADGAPGGTAGGQLTGALDELKGSAPASSATPDIWNAGGNYVPITQTADITGFPNAPQPGAKRNLFCVNGFRLVSSANLAVSGGTRNIAPGDQVEIVADTVSAFKAVIKRGNGLPTSAQVFLRADLYASSASGTFKVTGPHRSIVVGCGGSGAKVQGLAQSNITFSATGGAAGGLAIKDHDATLGDAFVFVAGTPGAALAVSNSSQNGNDGGTTTYTAPGVSITVNGGKGGTFSNTTSALLAGAVGGIASGGDYNYQGGNSGSCAPNPFTTQNAIGLQATGGGAVPWKGVPYSSGNVSITGAGARWYGVSGGAGIGGNSGNVSYISGSTYNGSGGGGAFGPSPSPAALNSLGANGPGQPLLNLWPLQLTGSGAGGPGNLGAGSAAAGTSLGSFTSNSAPMFGGTGAVYGDSSSGDTYASGAVDFGGGSGAVVCYLGSSAVGKAGGAMLLVLY